MQLIYDVTEKSYDDESVVMQMPKGFNNLIPKQASTFQSDTKGKPESEYYKNILCLVAVLFGHRAENTYDYIQLVREW